MSRRVAITGLSALSSVGLDADSNWRALMEGKSGIAKITKFNTEGFKTQFAGELKNFQPEKIVDPRDLKNLDAFCQYALVGAREALMQAGLTNGNDPVPENISKRFACIIGSGLGGLATIEAGKEVQLARGPSRISPFFIPALISNMAPGTVAIKFGLRGPNFTTTSACSSGAHAIGEAYRMIKNGTVDYAISGGAEATILPLGIGGFNAMRALSTRNDAPEKASRPFDKNRDGFVCGEGAGILVLEEYEAAKKRGAKILAELVGYAANCDAYHMTAPAEGGVGAAEAMRLALEDARLDPTKILAINAHGTSTPLGDVAETQAIKKTFGAHAYKIKVSSTKSMIGHTLGAAGGIESVYTIQALMHQRVPPTINYETPDPDCDLDCVPNKAQDWKHEYALSNSFGFGGTNASLIFRRAS